MHSTARQTRRCLELRTKGWGKAEVPSWAEGLTSHLLCCEGASVSYCLTTERAPTWGHNRGAKIPESHSAFVPGSALHLSELQLPVCKLSTLTPAPRDCCKLHVSVRMRYLPSSPLLLALLIFYFRFDLFIFRERGREGEREGEKHWCVRETSIGCLSRAPNQAPGPQPRLALNPLSHTSQHFSPYFRRRS